MATMKKSIVLMMILFSFASYSEKHQSLNKPESFINIEYGKIAVFDSKFRNSTYGIEYQNRSTIGWNLDNIFGALVSQRHNKYLYYGLNRDWYIKEPFILSTSVSIGLFDNNKLLDLGHTVEFRSKLTIAYELNNFHRFGVSISHLSNSKLSNKNPGTEMLGLNYYFALK